MVLELRTQFRDFGTRLEVIGVPIQNIFVTTRCGKSKSQSMGTGTTLSYVSMGTSITSGCPITSKHQLPNFLPSRSNKPSSRNSNAVPTCPNNDEVSFGWKSNSSTSLLLVLESSKLNPKFWNIQEIRLVSSEGSRYTWIPRYWHLVIIGCSSLLGCTFLHQKQMPFHTFKSRVKQKFYEL